MQLTGILREQTFSPAHHARNDRLILELSAQRLRTMGCKIQIISEEEVGQRELCSSVVFSMCQGPRANAVLWRLQREGVLVINSPAAIQNCYRGNLFQCLEVGQDPMPPTNIVRTDAAQELRLKVGSTGPWWVKRGDVHATQQGDVVKVHGYAECVDTLRAFRQRGIQWAAIQDHIEGMVVKFYGVTDSEFFRFYSEADYKVSPVAFLAAKPTIEKLVKKIGLEIYGGDAVLTPSGKIFVIDINDWPSFAYFRSEAAEVISIHIYRRAQLYLSKSLDQTTGRDKLVSLSKRIRT